MKEASRKGVDTRGTSTFIEMIRSGMIFPIVLILSVAGCLTPIDHLAKYEGGQIVISGQVSPLAENNIVSISITSSLIRLPEPVPGAGVRLLDGDGNEFFYVDRGDGKYFLHNFSGVPGNVYHIEVMLPDGRTYASSPEKMPVALGVDHVYHAFENVLYTDNEGVVAERTFISIYTDHTLPPSENPVYLKWDVEEVYMLSPTDFPDPFGNIPPSCYIAQRVDPQKINLFSTETVTAPEVPGLHLVSRLLDPSFKERHYFTTYQSSLTLQAYDYWKKVDVVANQVGSIFDPPPARVIGNLFNVADPNEEVHGYFQAVNQTFDRFYLLPDDLPVKMPVHCEYRDTRNYYDYPSECLNCTSVRNSSYSRPPWF